MTITLLSKPACVQCTATKRNLDSNSLEHETDDIYAHMDIIAELGYMSAPVVLVKDADGTLVVHWSGFRPDKIEALASEVKAA